MSGGTYHVNRMDSHIYGPKPALEIIRKYLQDRGEAAFAGEDGMYLYTRLDEQATQALSVFLRRLSLERPGDTIRVKGFHDADLYNAAIEAELRNGVYTNLE